MNLFNLCILLQVWGHLAPLAMAQASDPASSQSPDPSPAPQPEPDLQPVPAPDAQPDSLDPQSDPLSSELTELMIPVPGPLMGWIGSIGGLLGIIGFADTYIRKIIDWFKTPDPGPPRPPEKHDEAFFERFENKHRQIEQTTWRPRVAPKKDKNGHPSWKVGIQVGLDGAGLQGAGGDFPQICLWNMHGQLLGYNDATLHIAESKFEGHEKFNMDGARKDMPIILNGGLKAVGIWPAPGLEDRRDQQAVYVTMVKRHFDAVCVAAVFIQSHDEDNWLFDGSWGRASNMSWYYSYIIDSGRDGGECFWLDHRGDLKHKKDLEEEYIGSIVREIGKKPGGRGYPDWLWAAKVLPEAGIPEGDDLTDGMRKNGVHEYKVPLGVKFHGPQFSVRNYGDDLDNLTVSDFVDNPGRMDWITKPTYKNLRGGSPLLPILHPRASLSDKNPPLVWKDANTQDLPVDCFTDWYYDENDNLVEPGAGDRCLLLHTEPFQAQIQACRDKNFIEKYVPEEPEERRRSLDNDPGANQLPPSLRERHARTLINDKNRRRGGTGTRELCESPHSVGPSYANHKERFFCRMTDKTLWPFCDGAAGVSHDCFDAEADVLVEKNKPLGKRAHHWDKIEDWHSGERFKRAV